MKYGLVAGLVLFVIICAVVMNSGGNPSTVPVVRETVEESVERITPYRYGYLRGQRNFKIQMGSEDVLPLPSVEKYATSESSDDSEEENRGYVDGYHRAGEQMSCPQGYAR